MADPPSDFFERLGQPGGDGWETSRRAFELTSTEARG